MQVVKGMQVVDEKLIVFIFLPYSGRIKHWQIVSKSPKFSLPKLQKQLFSICLTLYYLYFTCMPFA